MAEERYIRVTGTGRLHLRPDRIRITMILTGLEEAYDETVGRSSLDMKKLRKLFVEHGFAPEDLKTTQFDIETEYERYKKGDTYKERFVGYKYSHDLKIEFDRDNERLGNILYALAHSKLKPKFDLEYTIRDTEKAKNELLANAVEDAKQKAAILSKAAGVTLKNIHSIDYSWGEVDFVSRPMDRMMLEDCSIMSKPDSYSFDIEPDDIDLDDTVTVIWTIE